MKFRYRWSAARIDARSIDCRPRRVVAAGDPLDVVRGQGREQPHAEDRDDPVDRSDPRKMFTIIAMRRPKTPMNRMPAHARQVALGHGAVDGRAGEHARRREERRGDRGRAARGRHDARDDHADRQAHRRAEHEEQAAATRVGDSLLIAPWITIDEPDLRDEDQEPPLGDALVELEARAHQVGDARRQQQAGEHPAERADEELLDELRRRADAQLGRGRRRVRACTGCRSSLAPFW